MSYQFFQVCPPKIFENRNDGILSLSAASAALAVGNNQQVVAAISGKRIKVMGWFMQSNHATAVSDFLLKSASAGTALTTTFSVPPSGSGFKDEAPIVESGYVETNTGEGLFIDVTTNTIRYTIFYIAYTP